jgi:hypothetical protein
MSILSRRNVPRKDKLLEMTALCSAIIKEYLSYQIAKTGGLSSEPKCNTPADLIIGTVDQDLRECCHALLFAFVG